MKKGSGTFFITLSDRLLEKVPDPFFRKEHR